MKNTKRNIVAGAVTLALATSLAAGLAPAIAGIDAAGAASKPFTSKLPAKVPAIVKVEAATASPAMTTAAVKVQAAEAVKVSASTPATGVKTKSSTTTQAVKRTAASGDETAQAKAILAGLIAKYPLLKGTTVSFGDARGYQAIALYKSGRIIINPAHTATLSRILNHEVWHIIDWRDNGRIDWGENVPPK